MKVTITSLEAYSLATKLGDWMDTKLPPRIALKVRRNFRTIQPHAQDRLEEERKIFDEFGGSFKDGSLSFDNDKGVDELKALNAESVNVELEPFSIAEFESAGMDVTPATLGLLDDLGLLEDE